jgi:fermentation-respiration switch protein FrsA (DUF1100 family)
MIRQVSVKRILAIVIISKYLQRLLLLSLLLELSGCSNLLFYPSKTMVRTPAELGIKYRDIEIHTADGIKLSAWWLDAQAEVKGTVLFLHGNAQNISTHIGSVYWLPEQGYQVLMLDYRGYGKSEGLPTLPAVFLDIEASFDWLLASSELGEAPVFVLAQSLGASMGGYVMAMHPKYREHLDAVVLDSGFSRYGDIATEVASRHWLTWLFQYPAAWFMPSQYDLIDHINEISPTPLLIVHGREDAVVPFTQGEAIYKRALKPKAMLSYDGVHIGAFKDLGNRKLLLNYFEAVHR